MLGQTAATWLERLHHQLGLGLRSRGGHKPTSDILAPQSTVASYHRDAPTMGPSADGVIDGWAVGQRARPKRRRRPRPPPALHRRSATVRQHRYDKSLTGTDLTGDQADLALLRRLEWARRLDPARLLNWFLRSGSTSPHVPKKPPPPRRWRLAGKSRWWTAPSSTTTPAMGASRSLASLLMDVRSYVRTHGRAQPRAPANEQGPRMDIIDRALGASNGTCPRHPVAR